MFLFLKMKLQEPTRNLYYASLSAVILLVLGEANAQAHKHALLHGSVRMSYSPSQKMGARKSMTWRFDKNNERTVILDTSEKPYYIYASRFRDRLRMSDELRTLTIMDLTMEDSGIYTIDVTDLNRRVESYSLNVTVYGGEGHKHALLHGSVRMSYSPSQRMRARKSMKWRFDKNGKRARILDTNVKPYYIYASRFRDRLQMSDELRTLTIMDLTMEDSGIYTTNVTDINVRGESYSLNVTVYEPVPPPRIWTEVQENTTDRCNVTLHCSVPSNSSDFSYTWQCGDRKPDCPLYNNGSTVQISLKNDSKDMEILCIVQNPADKKNVSFRVHEICKFTDRSRTATPLYLLIIKPVQCVLFLVPLIIYIAIIREKDSECPRGDRMLNHSTTC